jgi:hypothetical protein
MEFANTVESLGIETQIAVIGRDQNILHHQQNRLRGESTLPHFLNQLDKFPDPFFLSYELLYLYKEKYLKTLNLNIPIEWSHSKINEILENDPNKKYVHSVENYILDNCNRTGKILNKLPI